MGESAGRKSLINTGIDHIVKADAKVFLLTVASGTKLQNPNSLLCVLSHRGRTLLDAEEHARCAPPGRGPGLRRGAPA